MNIKWRQLLKFGVMFLAVVIALYLFMHIQ
jgi:hypothetical protein